MLRLPITLLLSLTCAVSLAQNSADEASDAAEQNSAPSQAVEDILRRDPELEDYVDEARCLHTQRIRSVDVIDDKHVSFKVARDKYYLVQLDHRCPGLRRGKPVIYEPSNGNRLCVHDGLRAVYENGLGGITPGMRCAINGFQSVTKEQLVMLKDALKAERRKKKKA